MEYDYSRLRGKIIEKFNNNGNFANEIGISERSLSLKLHNKIAFKQTEIDRARLLLDIPIEEISEYFFKKKVQ